MITAAEQEHIGDHGYVPEHVPDYVIAISESEPFLLGDFLVYVKEDRLIFVGYPLNKSLDRIAMEKTLQEAAKRFKSREVAVIAPVSPTSMGKAAQSSSDNYYRLDLSTLSISQKLRNMLNRAGRELSVRRSRNFSDRHERMVEEFVKTHSTAEATQFIFKRIGEYLSSCPTAWLFDAVNEKEELVGFDVAEFRPKTYALYMFNFSSETDYIPGASDLLLRDIIEQAKAEGKKYINLGLGINAGVTFFKRKWGGESYLPYRSELYQIKGKENLETLLQKL